MIKYTSIALLLFFPTLAWSQESIVQDENYRVSSLTERSNLVEYLYDPVGNRTSKTVTTIGISVYAKIFLQGAFNQSTVKLKNTLHQLELVPTTEPYTALGYSFVGGGGETVQPFVAKTLSGDKEMIDWLVVQIHDPNDPTVILGSKAAVLQADGSIVSSDLTNPVVFSVLANGNYIVTIKHRNHLPVSTVAPVMLTNDATTTVIDFTNPSTNTFGTDAQKNVNGVMVMRSGNTNSDGKVSYNGANNDKNAILFKVGLFTPNNVISGYHIEDVNMDGVVKYNGANNDKNAILFNVGLLTPNDIIEEQTPE